MANPNPFDRIKAFIDSRRNPGTQAPKGQESGPHEEIEDYLPFYEYDEVQKETLAPELEKEGLFFPEDPNDPAFEELVAKARAINPALAVSVEQTRQDTLLGNGGFMDEQRKRAERSSKPRDFIYKYLMVPNANGDPTLNKSLILGGLAVLGIGAFYLAGQTKHPSTTATASGVVGTTVENADGSTTTTYPDGSVMVRASDGTETTTYPDKRVEVKDTRTGKTTTTYPDKRVVVKEPDGSSTETLADGSVIHRDASDQVIANLPPSQLDSSLDTGTLLQKGTQPPVENTSTTITPPADGTTSATTPADSAATTPPADGIPAGEITPPTDTTTPPPTDSSVASPSTDTTTPPPSSTSSDPPYTVSESSTVTPPMDAGSTTSGSVTGQDALPVNSVTSPPASQVTLSEAPSTVTAPVPQAIHTPSTPSNVTVQTAQRLPSPATSDLAQAGVTRSAPSTITPRTPATAPESTTASAVAAARRNPTASVMRPATQTTSTQGSAATVLAYRRTEPTPTQVMRVGGTVTAATPSASNTSASVPASSGSGASVIYRRTTPQAQAQTAANTEALNTLPTTGLPDPNASSQPETTGGMMPSNNTTATPSAATPNTAIPGSAVPSPTAQTSLTGNAPGGLPYGPYRTGQYLRAKLETGVVLPVAATQDDTGPTQYVYARTQDGTLWLGTPKISATKRITLTFQQAVMRDGSEVQVNAVGYHLDGTPGLQTAWQDVAPTLANDLIRSSLTGVRDYAEAKIQATKTTTNANGSTTVERQVPTIWESVAGAATGVFQLPQTQNTFVTVARLNVGQDFVIVIAPRPIKDQ